MRSINIKTLCHTVLLISTLFAKNTFADEQINIGALVPLSGNWAELGNNIQQGLTLAAEEMNADNKQSGKKINLMFRDTDEEKSGGNVVTGYRFLRSKGIKFFIGPGGVPGIMALTPIAKNDDIILIGPTATNSFYKESNKFFNASGDNAVTSRAIADYSYKNGSKKVAIFGSLQPWESDQAKSFKDEFLKLGGAIVDEQYPQADQKDLSVEAIKIKSANPDTVFFAIFNQIAVAAKMLKQIDFKSKQFAAFIDDSHITSSEGSLNNTKLFLFSPPGKAFVERFNKRFGKDPGAFADSAYDALISLAKAINNSDSTETQKVIEALLSGAFQGSSGKLMKYDQDGLISREIVLHEVKAGKLEKVVD